MDSPFGDLVAVSKSDEASTYARNIENYIGVARVPVGIAGPLRIFGTAARGAYPIPLATTEAALVASYNRGMRLIALSGGCNAAVLDERMERTPAFVLRSLAQALTFVQWIREAQTDLVAAAELTSRYARCVAIEPIVEGNHVYLRCGFQTGEAAGQNMVTFATAAICRHIAEHSPIAIEAQVIEANCSGDKKATARVLSSVRGRRVSADVSIARPLLLEYLRVEPRQMGDYWRLGAIGAAMSGTVGLQGHYANGIAALAIATGQDAACVAESACGITRFEVDERGDLYACVTLPNVVVGTVGGGTGLPTPQAALGLLRTGGPLNAAALAEIVAGIALAGELSISGAICAGEFAAAHQRLARSAVPC
ncbi:MAG TPA: hydroxymethylglutaryl-CoA reductase [Candidatus Eremiobacteraceae bacterium]|nr:hydroxymethylglutaryl-CoA reductase [Candidatus Eremiobacteraceae bacterium]